MKTPRFKPPLSNLEAWQSARVGLEFPAIAAGAVCAQCLQERQRRDVKSYMTPNLGTHVRRTLHEHLAGGGGWWSTHVLCRWHATEKKDSVIYTLTEYAELRAAERVRSALESASD